MKKGAPLTKKRMTVHLGEVLRAARLKAELTQADVAERVGVATEVYGRMERGNLTPSLYSLRKLCLELRMAPGAALGLEADVAPAWPEEREPASEDSPRLRRLLRTLRQLNDRQLSAVGLMARCLVQLREGQQPSDEGEASGAR